MRRLAWLWIAAAALAACDAGGRGNELGLCSALCGCVGNDLPAQQRACVDECMTDHRLAAAPAACEQCLFENASRTCTDLADRCDAVCTPPVPVPEPELDAGM